MIDRYDSEVTTDRWQVTGHDVTAGPAVDRVVGFAVNQGMDRMLLGGLESVVAHAVSGVGRLVDDDGGVTIDAASDGDYLSVRIASASPRAAFDAPRLAVNLEWAGTEGLLGGYSADAGLTITLEFAMTAGQ
jgi:hypothetical protein